METERPKTLILVLASTGRAKTRFARDTSIELILCCTAQPPESRKRNDKHACELWRIDGCEGAVSNLAMRHATPASGGNRPLFWRIPSRGLPTRVDKTNATQSQVD